MFTSQLTKCIDFTVKYETHILVVLILFVVGGLQFLGDTILKSLNHIAFKFVIAGAVAVLAYKTPLLAVFLTVSYMLIIKEYKNSLTNSRKPLYSVVGDILSEKVNGSGMTATANIRPEYNVQPNDNKDVMMDWGFENIPYEPQHPSSRTLTDNIQMGNAEWRQMDDIQNNSLIPGGIDADDKYCSFTTA